MSAISIRAALETALAGINPPILTAWENQAFPSQPATVAYQQVYLMLADPENPEMGDTMRREMGIFQINLFYPPKTGPRDAATRAELIRSVFHRGASFTAGGVTVVIERTPTIGQGTSEGDHWMLPVKIRFFANIVTP